MKANKDGAVALGKVIADKAKAASVVSVVFDRSGRRYHGCIKSFAEAAREGGLKFKELLYEYTKQFIFSKKTRPKKYLSMSKRLSTSIVARRL